MRSQYIPLREIHGSVTNGMNAPSSGTRFGRLGDAFKHESAYWGDRRDWFVVAAHNRDSDILDESNWQSLLEMLGGESDGLVAVERASHWICGWVEYLCIHPRNRTALRTAILAHSSLSQYPILDEEKHSQLEDESCRQTWEKCFNTQDRVDYFRKHSYCRGMFSTLLRAVRGSWDDAASVLNCPGDLAY